MPDGPCTQAPGADPPRAGDGLDLGTAFGYLTVRVRIL